jgi:RNA polymerase sigma-70 factor (ECF subfamily)
MSPVPVANSCMVEKEEPSEPAVADASTELVRRIKAGDQQAFAELFSVFRPRLWRFINLRLHPQLRGRVDPDDVLQEFWLRAVARMEYFPDTATPAGFIWFRMILTQTLIELQRRHLGAEKRSAIRERSLNGGWTPESTSSSLAIQISGHFTTPSSAFIRAEIAGQLEVALQGLDDMDREVLALRHFEELSNAETAMALNLSVAAASKRYIRALQRLKGVLELIPGLQPQMLRKK